jgi:hypothetical protein
MSCVSVLRIGPFPIDSDAAHKLREAIVKHLAVARTGTTTGTPGERVDTNIGIQLESPHYQFSITNRYFSANVRLAGIDEETSSNVNDPNTSTRTSDSAMSMSEDGMILVFEAERSHPKYATSITSSFDAMEPIHDHAMMRSRCGELLRLCVSVGNNRVVQYNGSTQVLSDKEYEDEYSRRILWCLDHGYEYVEVPDLLDTSQGHDARDKDGFARIIEAISGTVWTSAIMAPNQQLTLQQSFAETRKDVNIVATTPPHNSSSLSLPPDQAVNDDGYEPPNPQDFPSATVDENDQERERKAHEALLAECISETQTDDNTTAFAASNGTTAMTTEELKQERAMNALEASLNEARRIRELSKSGQLSDEERRKRAADAAMLIMKTMEQMGFNEDDDDEEIDDDNSLVDDDDDNV